jgi:hypothetical protein
MFTWLRQMMAVRAARRRAQETAAQRLAVALVQQAQAATTVRHLALVQALAQEMYSLPVRQRLAVRRLVALAVERRLLDLPAAPNRASQTSSSSKVQTGRRTTKLRR